METKKQSIITEKDLNLLWRIVRTNWYIPILIVPFFYLAGYFYAYKQIDVYQAQTQLLLNKNDEYSSGNVVTDAGALYIDNSNEMKVIGSYDIMKETMKRLKDRLQVSYYIVGRVRVTEYFNGLPFEVIVSNVNPGWYEVPLDVKIIDYDHFEITLPDKTIQPIKGEFNKELINVDFNLTIRRTSIFDKGLVGSMQSTNYQIIIHSVEWLIANFQRGMSVENPEYTNILEIKMKDIIPERALLVLDTLNQVYTENTLKSKIELNEKTIVYIDKQLDEISFNLKNIEDTMQSYKARRNILDLEWEREDFLEKLSSLDNQRSTYNFQIEALNDLEKYIIEDKDPQFLPPNVFVIEKEGFMKEAVQELYSKQIELNKIYNTAKESYPGINDLKQTINKLKQDLLIYINNARKATTKMIENVNSQMRSYVGDVQQIPSKQRDILNIQRKVNVSEQLYNFLLERRANTRIARASIIPNVKIIEQPRSMGVVEPNKSKIINSFMSFGLMIVFVLIALRVFFFTRIKSVNHLKELTDLPVIGVLPLLKVPVDKGIVVDEQPNSKISEAFRNLRTNLQYANIDAQARSILVTSFAPGEGKTFTSVNIATILAKTGKKVVILELDLHKPRVFRMLGAQPQIGITTHLAGLNSFEEIIGKTAIDNLDCVFAGPIPPNPSELVLSEKLKELIIRCKENYDYVIIDTPPAGLLSDAIYLMQFVDASLFVLNTKSANKKVVNFVQHLVDANKIKNMFLILNGVRSLSGKYYYKGYGYTYGYGYGYGYGKGYGQGSYKKI
ncbi:MAG: polysaccharide biosynthesis tyrosine autokinase [Bacteroidetes bacterium]|nr:polysaccharide biosynthesis tyrosine autokinase [Bacteroidota bacterium]